MKIVTIHLTQLDDYGRTYFGELRRTLRPHQLWHRDFLYTVIDGKRISSFAQTGTYRPGDTIFAYTPRELDEMAKDTTADNEEIEDHLLKYFPPALAIYLSAHFLNHHTFVPGNDEDHLCLSQYKFKNPQKKLEALAGVALIHLPKVC